MEVLMNAWKPLLFVLALMAALPLTSEGKSSTCNHAVKGTWSFGQAPKGCELNYTAAEQTTLYEGLIFVADQDGEQERYMELMYAFLRDASDYYLDQRKNATAEEKEYWRRSIFALAHQESYWSHFRLAIGKGQEVASVKFMRGDRGYGHGILQIDERWHPNISLSEKGEDLVGNLMYGLDVFYQAWERAEGAKCVKEGNLEQRARSAYSIYNGGPDEKCRWTDPADEWARNDKGYYKKLKNQEWLQFVADTEKESPVDVACVVEGGEDCGAGVATAPFFMPHDSIFGVVQESAPAALAVLRLSRTRNSFV